MAFVKISYSTIGGDSSADNDGNLETLPGQMHFHDTETFEALEFTLYFYCDCSESDIYCRDFVCVKKVIESCSCLDWSLRIVVILD